MIHTKNNKNHRDMKNFISNNNFVHRQLLHCSNQSLLCSTIRQTLTVLSGSCSKYFSKICPFSSLSLPFIFPKGLRKREKHLPTHTQTEKSTSQFHRTWTLNTNTISLSLHLHLTNQTLSLFCSPLTLFSFFPATSSLYHFLCNFLSLSTIFSATFSFYHFLCTNGNYSSLQARVSRDSVVPSRLCNFVVVLSFFLLLLLSLPFFPLSLSKISSAGGWTAGAGIWRWWTWIRRESEAEGWGLNRRGEDRAVVVSLSGMCLFCCLSLFLREWMLVWDSIALLKKNNFSPVSEPLLRENQMGFSLKEALRTLCSRNRWSYAVFWKIGCNNSKWVSYTFLFVSLSILLVCEKFGGNQVWLLGGFSVGCDFDACTFWGEGGSHVFRFYFWGCFVFKIKSTC